MEDKESPRPTKIAAETIVRSLRDTLGYELLSTLFKAFRIYFEILEALAKLVFPNYRRAKIFDGILGDSASNASIDDRIKKIDSARENLQDAIDAIDQLREQASINKRELENALERLHEAERKKQEVSSQLHALKVVAEVDTKAFQRIAGIASKSDVWRERLLGFGSGVLASTVASILFLFLQKII